MSAGFPVPQNEVIDLSGNVIEADDFMVDGVSISGTIIDVSDIEEAIVEINTDIGDLQTQADSFQTSLDLKAPLASPDLDQPIFTRARELTSGSDLDDLIDAGFYVIRNPLNAPASGDYWWYVIVQRHSTNSSFVIQDAVPMTAPGANTPAANRHIRSKVPAGWNAWTALSAVGHTHTISAIIGLQDDLDELAQGIIRPEMFGGAADSNGTTGNGTDNADAFDDMFEYAKLNTDVEIRLSAGYYRLSREISQVDAGRSFTIKGQGGWQTFLYGDFVGAGDYILNLSNSSGDSYNTRGHRISGIAFYGNGVPGDPQGLGLENAFEHYVEDINAPNLNNKVLRNSVIVVTRDNNSKFNLVRSQGGWQPQAVSIPSGATASFTSGSPTITGNTAYFTPAMIGATIFFSKGSTSALNLLWSATITDVPTNPSTTCTIGTNAPTTQTGAVVGIGLISGSITSGTNQLTLSGGVDIDDDYIGMQVHVPGASLKTDAGSTDGLLSTRITAVTGNVLTLADNATATATGAIVYFAPAAFLGSFEGEDTSRQTNHSWWSDTQFEGFFCAGLIVNRAIYTKFDKLKVHGRGFFTSDWVQCYNSILMSEVKNVDISHVQMAFGARSRKMIISGSRGVVNLDNVEVGHIYLNTSPILVEEVTDEFALCPGLITAVYGLDGFGEQVQLIEVPAPHNVEYGVVFTRNQRLEQKTRNTAIYSPGATGQYAYVEIADDSVYSFKPPGNFGRVHITSPSSQVDGEVKFRTSDYPSLGVQAQLVRDAGSLAASTSVLTGTTGADGKVTIAPDSSGNIRIENRFGNTIFVAFFVMPFGNVTA